MRQLTEETFDKIRNSAYGVPRGGTVTVNAEDLIMLCASVNKPYNGWKNYETWCTSLMLNDSQESQDTARVYAREGEDALKEHVEEIHGIYDDVISLYTKNIIGAALSEVDWRRLCESLLEGEEP